MALLQQKYPWKDQELAEPFEDGPRDIELPVDAYYTVTRDADGDWIIVGGDWHGCIYPGAVDTEGVPAHLTRGRQVYDVRYDGDGKTPQPAAPKGGSDATQTNREQPSARQAADQSKKRKPRSTPGRKK